MINLFTDKSIEQVVHIFTGFRFDLLGKLKNGSGFTQDKTTTTFSSLKVSQIIIVIEVHYIPVLAYITLVQP